MGFSEAHRSIEDARAQAAELDRLIGIADANGVPVPQELRDKAAWARSELDKVEASLAVRKAEETAMVAEVWRTFDDAMALSAEIAMDADEHFARGDEATAGAATVVADAVKRVAQTVTREIVES